MKGNRKIVRSGLVAALAVLVLIGMFFVPAVAADDHHYDGNNKYELTNILLTYNTDTKSISVESKSGAPGAAFVLGEKVNATCFNSTPKDGDVLVVDVDIKVDLSTADDGAFEELTNSTINYLGSATNTNLFGTSRPIYKVVANESSVYILNETDEYVTSGSTICVDTIWALPNQTIKIAVKPAQGYGVFDWYLNYGLSINKNALLTPVTDYIVKSKLSTDGATTYNLTLPDKTNMSGKAGFYVEPRLRDSGSTIVSYVFLDADTYIMTIPADFAMQKIGQPVTGKYLNITSCDLLDNHTLNVTMKSENYQTTAFYKGLSGFAMKNVNQDAYAKYNISMRTNYTGAADFDDILENNATLLDTKGMNATVIAEHVKNSSLNTELKFNLIGIAQPDVLGKYKDKLTFIAATFDNTPVTP